jgi:hypothetical protein
VLFLFKYITIKSGSFFVVIVKQIEKAYGQLPAGIAQSELPFGVWCAMCRSAQEGGGTAGIGSDDSLSVSPAGTAFFPLNMLTARKFWTRAAANMAQS